MIWIIMNHSKVAVYIGRFQPFHYGHKAIIDELITKGYYVLVLIGTPSSKSDRNPIPPSVVRDTIMCQYKVTDPIAFRYLHDKADNASWLQELEDICQKFSKVADFSLVIHNKPSEAGKYGLPEGQFISDFILTNSTKITGSIDLSSMETPSINATDIRNSMTELLKLAPKSSLQNLLAAL